MATSTLPNIGITAGYQPGESGWSATMNRNLRVIDLMLNPRVIDKDLSIPPSAASGDAYLVPASGQDAWAGHVNDIAVWCIGADMPDGEWAFVTPKESTRVYVIDESAFYVFKAGQWSLESGSGEVTQYRTTIGDGTAANFFINHGLATRDVSVTIYRNATPWDDVVVDVTRPSVDQVEISGLAIAPSVDEYVVIVRKG